MCERAEEDDTNDSGITLAIVGSRTFSDYSLLCEEIDKLRMTINITRVVSGGARGADFLGEKYAKEKNIPIVILRANWSKYGKRAGVLRNGDIVKMSDRVIAFWDGKSRGTKNTIELAEKHGKPSHVVQV